MCTPLVYRGLVYIVKYNGVLTVYDAKTGEQKFQQRLAGGTSAFTSSPIAADGKIYLASEDGHVFVLKAGPAFEVHRRKRHDRKRPRHAGDLGGHAAAFARSLSSSRSRASDARRGMATARRAQAPEPILWSQSDVLLLPARRRVSPVRDPGRRCVGVRDRHHRAETAGTAGVVSRRPRKRTTAGSSSRTIWSPPAGGARTAAISAAVALERRRSLPRRSSLSEGCLFSTRAPARFC